MKRHPRYILPVLYFLSISLFCHSQGDGSRDAVIEEELERLDGIISSRPAREEKKIGEIREKTTTLFKRSTSYGKKMGIARELVSDYTSFQLDSLILYLEEQMRYADASMDDQQIASSSIALSEAFTSGGFYTEAYDILSSIDTSILVSSPKTEYFMACYRLSRSLSSDPSKPLNYPLLEEDEAHCLRRAVYFDRGKSSDGVALRRALLDLSQGNYSAARTSLEPILTDKDISRESFAEAALLQSTVCSLQGNDSESLYWKILSAQSDMTCLRRNYTSLIAVASEIAPSDPGRALRYIRQCLDDALLYGGKVQVGEISKVLPLIGDSYDTLAPEESTKSGPVVLIVILSLLLIGALTFLFLLYRKSHSSGVATAKGGEEDASASEELSMAKDRQRSLFAAFLSRQADTMDKFRTFETTVAKNLKSNRGAEILKEMTLSKTSDVGAEEFCRFFDRTFLEMYPSFMDQFNDLLTEGERFEVKDGVLPTELRIYALMRLGIEDTGEIAKILNYSVRTIYNYKVKVKGAARIPKEEFDAAVRRIGQ